MKPCHEAPRASTDMKDEPIRIKQQSEFTRWRPRLRLSHWVVFVEEWLHRPLDGIASTTGRYFEASPLL